VEAISNGIPAFRKPTSKNAAVTLGWMAGILGSTFFMICFIAAWMRPVPSESESLLSVMGRAVYGDGNPMYYVLQFATMAILILAANTAYADFPRLAAIIGRDGFLPRQFSNRGDRLVFSNGVLILAGAASVLLVAFGGNVTLLIPLYAVGVFTSFTISQVGMVVHHLHERQSKWQLSVVNSGLGAIATFIVALVVIISKFAIGAWVIVLLIPLIVVAFKFVRRHYAHVADDLRLSPEHVEDLAPLHHGVVVLIGGVNRSSVGAIRYARSVGSEDSVALTVAMDEDHADRIRAEWEKFGVDFPLDIIESEFRDLTHTVEDYLDDLDERWGHDYLTVVIPEFVLPHWYQGIFHNQSALALKLALKFRPDTVVVNVPYLMGSAADITEQQLGMDRSKDPAYTVEEVAPGNATGAASSGDD
jgi:hypothetical protein